MRQIIFICWTVLSVVSCHSAKEKTPLGGVKWIAETLQGKKIKMKEGSSEVFFLLDTLGKRVNGKAGCNRFFGDYVRDKEKLSFSSLGATKAFCLDMAVELAFFQVLESTDSFVIKNDQLRLKHEGEVIAVFKAEKK